MSTMISLGELAIEHRSDGFILKGPAGPGEATVLGCDPAIISDYVRVDDSGRYRPLSGARTMPSGWMTPCASEGELHAALDAIYPLARRHQAQWRAGTLRVAPLADGLIRQSGRNADSAGLSETGRTLVTETLCGECVRTPVWAGTSAPEDAIPCPEACSVLVALCRETAIWERDAPPPSGINPSVGYADFEQTGNAIRETILGKMDVSQRS